MKEKKRLQKNFFIRFVNSISNALNQFIKRDPTAFVLHKEEKKNLVTSSSFSYSKSSSINSKGSSNNTHKRLLIKRRIRRLSIRNKIFKQHNPLHTNCKKDKLSECLIEINSLQKELSTTTLFLNAFRFISVLGRGQFGKVFLSQFKLTEKYYAIKTIKKEQLIIGNATNLVLNEKKILEIINKHKHPFLIQMHASFQTSRHVFFVIEYASGGDLITSILKEKFYSKKRACFYAGCIVLALKFLHENNILYRDLKLDNLLLDSEGYIKLTDFGISKLNFKYSDKTYTFCGTDDYMAPEILLRQGYNRAVDWWSLGVVIYEMLIGKLPFSNKFQRLNRPVSYPRFISKESKNFIDKLLCKNQKSRLGSSENGAEDIKSNPFFKQLDWDKLFLKRIKAPHIPIIRSIRDVSNFSEQFTLEDPCLTPSNNTNRPKNECQNSLVFENFDFISEYF